MTLVLVTASFLSGAKGALVFVTLVLGSALLLSRKYGVLLVSAAVLPAVYVSALTLSGVDVGVMLDFIWDYSVYNFQEFGVNQILETFYNYPLGIGTGMTTGAARYAFGNVDLAYESILFFEIYYAKTIAELSLLGLVPVVILMFTPIIQSARLAMLTNDRDVRSFSAGFFAFFFFVAVLSYKAWPLDAEPVNVLFWVLSGVFYKLSFFAYQKNPNMGQRLARNSRLRAKLALAIKTNYAPLQLVK